MKGSNGIELFNLVLKRHWKSMENDFQKCVRTLIYITVK